MDCKLLKMSKIIIVIIFYSFLRIKRKKKIGVIGLKHGNNIGNNLLKYAISIILSELGFEPYIIGIKRKYCNISFINKTINLRILKNNFSEISINDYDILMVNSDQTWRKTDRHFYDHAFLKFAKNWSIPKFIYGASLGYDSWILTKEDEKIAKECLKNFTGISVREKRSIELIKKHLGFNPKFVLDPTLLIDKKYYINIIKDYKNDLNINDNYIFTYLISGKKKVVNFIKTASLKLGYKVNNVTMNSENYIEKFIYGIIHSNSVITDSFHGTIFSIIFNKPFISLVNSHCYKERFISLKNLLKLGNRIISDNLTPDITLLTTPLNIDYNLINSLKIKSIII